MLGFRHTQSNSYVYLQGTIDKALSHSLLADRAHVHSEINSRLFQRPSNFAVSRADPLIYNNLRTSGTYLRSLRNLFYAQSINLSQ